MKIDLAASVRARLLNVAKARGVDFNQVLVRFALERILYRLSQSEHADRFLLKGALLFTLWYAMPRRATRDADLLSFGASDLESVTQTFRDIASVEVTRCKATSISNALEFSNCATVFNIILWTQIGGVVKLNVCIVHIIQNQLAFT
jgi:predicted nucleotidyltransferase component of viral defense system